MAINGGSAYQTFPTRSKGRETETLKTRFLVLPIPSLISLKPIDKRVSRLSIKGVRQASPNTPAIAS